MEILGRPADAAARLVHRAMRAEAEAARLRARVDQLETEQAALWWAAGHDELTGLPNRRLFHTLAPLVLGACSRPAVVVVLDLNGFKPINDAYGHCAGDQILCTVARRLTIGARDHLVARLGGDEFAAMVVSPHSQSPGQWWHPAVSALAQVIAEPMQVAGQHIRVTASIGVVPVRGRTPVVELLEAADLAMYRAKHHAKATGRSDAVGVWDLSDNDSRILAYD